MIKYGQLRALRVTFLRFFDNSDPSGVVSKQCFR